MKFYMISGILKANTAVNSFVFQGTDHFNYTADVYIINVDVILPFISI